MLANKFVICLNLDANFKNSNLTGILSLSVGHYEYNSLFWGTYEVDVSVTDDCRL
jgi:hypothetical protein